ncbi:hypothetical protein [Streptomyces mirabilis]|uniref:hypothetical protein n=1 Tax=Streptomyces mirabilis TaxID=68239 RepID=UPI000B01DD02
MAAPRPRGGLERARLDDLLAFILRGLEPDVKVVQRRFCDGKSVAVLAPIAFVEAAQQLGPLDGDYQKNYPPPTTSHGEYSNRFFGFV